MAFRSVARVTSGALFERACDAGRASCRRQDLRTGTLAALGRRHVWVSSDGGPRKRGGHQVEIGRRRDGDMGRDVYGRVLSIQSSVVSGYVGNKSAVFPLQLLGFHVDILNSVQFSNHTGYQNGWSGERLGGDELVNLVEGMEKNNLLSQITHLLTGYAGSVSFLRAVVRVYQMLRQRNPDIIFVCDPVLGDGGNFYVPREMLSVYQEEVLPLANVLTPNAFELGVLSGMDDKWGSNPQTPSEIFSACDRLHEYGVKVVVVTSSVNTSPDKIVAFSSQRTGEGKSAERFMYAMDMIAEQFTGGGDLTSALLLAHLTRGNFESVRDACCAAFATTAEVLHRTHRSERGEGLSSRPELQLISSQDAILHPPLERVKASQWGESTSST